MSFQTESSELASYFLSFVKQGDGNDEENDEEKVKC